MTTATVFVTGGTGRSGHSLRDTLLARERAIRLGLLPLRQSVTALVAAVRTPPVSAVRIVDVPAIARAQLRPQRN